MMRVIYSQATQFESIGRNGHAPTHGIEVSVVGVDVTLKPLLRRGTPQRANLQVSVQHAHEVANAILQEAKSPWVLRPARSDATILAQTCRITDMILALAGFEVGPELKASQDYANCTSLRVAKVWQTACAIQEMLTQSETPDAE